MKTTTHQWKGMLFLFLLLFSLSSYTQDNTQNVEEFVRVYNLDGKKIGKGNINFINDTIIKIRKGGRIESIKIKDIGIIKTKHSAGHNVLIGAAIGGGTLGVLGAATADPDAWILGYSAPEGFAGGLVIGGTAGAALGGITALFKTSNTYLINGDLEKLKLFMEMISK